MGYRIVVILNNDQSSTWMNDENLGKRIFIAAGQLGLDPVSIGNIGQVVECGNADTQSLIIVDSFSATRHATTMPYHGQTEEERDLILLKQLADKMGYRISKKSAK